MRDAGLSPSLMTRLATQLECLPLVLGGRGSDDVIRRPASGKWSAHENLAHLARIHEVYLERMRRILSEERPPLSRYKAEEDPEWSKWANLSPDEVLKRLRSLRGELVTFVTQLSPEQLGRVGVHQALGSMTIPEWIEFFLLHEAHHLYVVMQRARGG